MSSKERNTITQLAIYPLLSAVTWDQSCHSIVLVTLGCMYVGELGV